MVSLINDPRLPQLSVDPKSFDEFSDFLEKAYENADKFKADHTEEIKKVEALHKWVTSDMRRYEAIAKFVDAHPMSMDGLHSIEGVLNVNVRLSDLGISRFYVYKGNFDALIFGVQMKQHLGWTKPIRHGHNDAPVPDPIFNYLETYTLEEFYEKYKDDIDKIS